MKEQTKSQQQQNQAEATLLITAAVMSAVVAMACAVFWSNFTMAVTLGLLSVMMICLLVLKRK